MAEHLKGLTQRQETRKKKERVKERKKRKNSQAIISFLPFQRIRHHFTLHHRMQFLSIISDVYFDFRDTSLYSLSKLKRGILLSISTTKKSWFHLPQQFINSLMPSGAAKLPTGTVLLQDYACGILECSILRVSSYWPNMRHHNETGLSTVIWIHREIIHCCAYTSQIPIIPYFRVVD